MNLFAPDLINGTIFNRIGILKQWATNIQSVLKLESEQQSSQYFYLSHEYRNNSIFFEQDAKNRSIYQYHLQKNLEGSFLTYSHNEKFYLTLGYDLIADREHTQPITKSNKRLFVPFTNKNWFSEVYCENVRVYPVSFEEVYQSCQAKTLSIPDLYFKIENIGEQVDAKFTLFSPVRYLNFSNASFPGMNKHYLQLISGDCLIPLPNGFPGPVSLASALDLNDYSHYTEATYQVYDNIEDDSLQSSSALLQYRGLLNFYSKVQFFRF